MPKKVPKETYAGSSVTRAPTNEALDHMHRAMHSAVFSHVGGRGFKSFSAYQNDLVNKLNNLLDFLSSWIIILSVERFLF